MGRYAYWCGACQARAPWRWAKQAARDDQHVHRTRTHGGLAPDGETILLHQRGPSTPEMAVGIAHGIRQAGTAIAEAWRRSPAIRAVRVELGRTRWWVPTRWALRGLAVAWLLGLWLWPEVTFAPVIWAWNL